MLVALFFSLLRRHYSNQKCRCLFRKRVEQQRNTEVVFKIGADAQEPIIAMPLCKPNFDWLFGNTLDRSVHQVLILARPDDTSSRLLLADFLCDNAKYSKSFLNVPKSKRSIAIQLNLTHIYVFMSPLLKYA